MAAPASALATINDDLLTAILELLLRGPPFYDDGAGLPTPPLAPRSPVSLALDSIPRTDLGGLRARLAVAAGLAAVCARWSEALGRGGSGSGGWFNSLVFDQERVLRSGACPVLRESAAWRGLEGLGRRCARVWIRPGDSAARRDPSGAGRGAAFILSCLWSRALPNIVCLSVRGCALDAASLRALSGRPFVRLDLGGADARDDGLALLLAGAGPTLTSLRVDGCRELTAAGAGAIARANLGVLERLDVAGCVGLTSRDLAVAVAALRGTLRFLDVTRCGGDGGFAAAVGGALEPGDLVRYAKGCGLECLEGRVDASATSASAPPIALTIDDANEASDALAGRLAAPRIVVAREGRVPAGAVVGGGWEPVRLSALDVRGFGGRRRSAAPSLSDALPRIARAHGATLASVAVRGGGGAFDADALVSALAEGAPGLVALALRRCAATDAAVTAILSGGFAALVDLDLDGCSRITEDGISRAIAGSTAGLPPLRSLSLSRLRAVGDAAFGAIASAFEGLARLGLDECCRLSDEGLAVLATRSVLPVLSRLSIRGVKRGRLSGDAVALLRAARPNLSVEGIFAARPRGDARAAFDRAWSRPPA